VSTVFRIDRVRRDVERLPDAPADPDAFYGALVSVLDAHGLPFAGACWHLTDPVTGLFTWTGATGVLPGDFVTALENEYLEDDVAKYSELAARRAHASALVVETDGRPERSARYRRYLAPDGFADELRFAFVDTYGRWGSMGLFSERAYTADEQDAASELVPLVAGALRRGIARTAPPVDEAPPGFLLLDAEDRVRSRDARAEELLAGCAQTCDCPGRCTSWRGRRDRWGGRPAGARGARRAHGSPSTRARSSARPPRSRSCCARHRRRRCSTSACAPPA
jgi:hypothetical protein